MPDWLDLELAHRLGPTKAPDELWDRVMAGPRPLRRQRSWPVAATLTITALAGVMWMTAKGQTPPHRPPQTSECLAPVSFRVDERRTVKLVARVPTHTDSSCRICHSNL